MYLQSLSGVHSLSPPLSLTVWSQAPSSCLDGGNGLRPSTAVLVLPPSRCTLFPVVRRLLLQQKWNYSSAPKASSRAIPRHFSMWLFTPNFTCSAPWSLCSSQTGLLPLSPMCQASSRLGFLHWSFLLLPETLFPRMSTCLMLISYNSLAQMTPSLWCLLWWPYKKMQPLPSLSISLTWFSFPHST